MKLFKKISFALSAFVLGIQTKIFASGMAVPLYGVISDENKVNAIRENAIFDPGQTDIYGPAPDPVASNVTNKISSIEQPAIYGPAPDPIRIRTTTGLVPGQILSILVSILLFFIGISVALNRRIKKNVKIITLSVISVFIVVLVLLTIFVF